MSDEIIWFYLQNGKSLGPFSKNQLVQLSFSGKISKETLVWAQSKNQEWKPLGEVFNLREELPPPIPGYQANSPSNVSNTTISTSIDSLQPHPWRRYFGRIFDLTLNGTIMGLGLGIIFAAIAPVEANRFFSYIADPKNKFAELFLTSLIVPFANAAFIGFTGTSIGKWLFGIRILDQSNRVIGYRIALKREFLVWCYGLGCGILFANIIAALYQRYQLDKNKITSWDKSLGLKVVYRQDGTLQHVLSATGLFLFFAMYFILSRL